MTRAPRSRRARRIAVLLAPFLFAVLLAIWLASLGTLARAHEPVVEPPSVEEDDEAASPYRSGLLARYRGADAIEHARRDDRIAFVWGTRAPDERLSPGPFTATYTGYLLVQTPGVYRLRAFAAGRVRVTVADRTILDGHRREAGWLDGEPIELAFGYHPLRVEYERADEDAHLSLFWEGPQFAIEPLGSRWLAHRAGDAPSNGFERGAVAVRALRCAACHALPSEPEPLAAPSLAYLTKNVSRDWLIDWLADSDAEQETSEKPPERRMPRFALSRDDATAVAAFLLASSADSPPPRSAPEIKESQPTAKEATSAPLAPPSAAAGHSLFRTVGCLACHRAEGLGTRGWFGGGDLSRIAEKRPTDFFARWLVDPQQLNPDHHMPIFPLSAGELQSLTLYLQSLGTGANDATRAAPEPATIERGRQLVEQSGCVQCHALPATARIVRKPAARKLDVGAIARPDGGCLDRPATMPKRPGYSVAPELRRAIVSFLASSAGRPSENAGPLGARLLTEKNCLACHAREQSAGLASLGPAIVEKEPKLASVLSALWPPSLTGVGDKLTAESLSGAISLAEPPRQPWLLVRMPRFRLQPRETAALARHLIDTDRIPPLAAQPPAEPISTDDAVVEAAAARLVTADGFGCTSCHAIGKWMPPKVAPAAAGADLSMIGRRVRREWFDRWVRNPARIVPRMEMPAVVQPVRGVLDGKLEPQLVAIWQVLNRPGFTPPAPNALRVVRRANLSDVPEPAAVLTELIEADGRRFVKPLVLGLSNRHNVLFDLATNRLAAWWIGETARQRTRGKSWFWEAGIPQLLARESRDADNSSGELQLVDGSEAIEPVPRGEYVTEFDTLEHIDGGVEFTQHLNFAPCAGARSLKVRQQIVALRSVRPSGFRRRWQFSSAHAMDIELVVARGSITLDPTGRQASWPGRGSRLSVELRSPAGVRFEQAAGAIALRLRVPAGGCAICEIDYLADVATDSFAPPPVVDRSVTRQELRVVPGFEAVRLPVTDQAMPTALAWRGDGRLLVASLEGRVWLAEDRDRDGLEDRLEPFSDDLAVPYGLSVVGDAVDVINKYGLLRLWDRDGDGHVERMELLASGWGHTRDYHDWAVGLPRDDEGNYYVSLACQQDDRSAAAAELRGSVVQLRPRAPTDDDPRRYALEPLATGLRFPQGIARSRAGDLFVTDNQGHYTPFNELNEVVPGSRYGFINRRDRDRELSGPVHTAAIEIPHPWTRSVNGIYFLETPASMRAREDIDFFGPFEGHLIGCEYDTRRLVRMSLERVGGAMQGAVYPFSHEPNVGEETFEGPLCCAVAPNADLYIGNIRDSGWGAGSNTGSVVRLRRAGQLPLGIAEVRAARDGFVLHFTAPVDRQRAARAANYRVASYRREATPEYGGPDLDRRVESIRALEVSADGRSVKLGLDGLREGFVYEFHLSNLAGAERFFPAEAYYTLRHRLP